MQNCLGIYIEDHLIKYAKVSKDKNEYKVESFGMVFFDNLSETIKKTIEETYSFSTPISINLANEKYLYFDVFALLSKNDVTKTIQTEFDAYCDEKGYNEKTFETRNALVPNLEDKDKIRAIDVIVNKIELNKQKQYLEKHHLTRIAPIGTAIASIVRLAKKENILIVNMEEKTTITTIYDRQIYNVETIESGSLDVLGKINQVENSLKRAYEICKETTIYTSDVIEDTKEQPYLENIIPTLYQISQKVQSVVAESPAKITTVYLTGTLAAVNNIDLYFQEFLHSSECRILRPNIMEENSTQVNIKDYIEVNSAIALAMQALGEGMQAFNFKKITVLDKIKSAVDIDLSSLNKKKNKKNKKTSDKPSKLKKSLNFNFNLNKSFKGKLDKTEIVFVRCAVALLLINIIFTVFSKTLYSKMTKKNDEIVSLTTEENAQISKMNDDINSLNSKNTKYTTLIEDLKEVNDKISDIAQRKNAIPNLLNQIMFVIPESVQLTSIQNTTDKKIVIEAQSDDYDQLGYFIAKLKVEGILNNVVSSSGQKSDNLVTVSIEGELP